MKINLMQLLRLVVMVLAIAGIIYALEYLEHGIAVWFWVTVLGVGFVGLLYSFRVTQPCEGAGRPQTSAPGTPLIADRGRRTPGARESPRMPGRKKPGIWEEKARMPDCYILPRRSGNGT